jgi:EAL domain-containing protein (putative c-di-GMP-specific phosphodiesterase class I)
MEIRNLMSADFSYGQWEAKMHRHSDISNIGVVEIVKSAIADGRASFNVQSVHSVEPFDAVFYRECLATLQGTDGCHYGAGIFIPTLEELGYCSLIDENVVRLALDELEIDPCAVLGCNISADNLRNRETWDLIAGQVRSRPTLASRLVLELTETRPLLDVTRSVNMLNEMRELGCRIALDDFGAGYASPQLLRLVDFDIVKIDRSFLQPTRRSCLDLDALAHLISFASCYSPVVVMEGVETIEDAQSAALCGATHLQGYGISLPVPVSANKTGFRGSYATQAADITCPNVAPGSASNVYRAHHDGHLKSWPPRESRQAPLPVTDFP